jgi:hypothetical protein
VIHVPLRQLRGTGRGDRGVLQTGKHKD